MQVTHGTIKPGGGPVGLTIGNFDGVHRGHHAMLARLVAKARALNLPSCVLTFEPHPREFFAPAAAPTRLARLREKLELIAEAGIDRVHILRFDARLAALDAARFIEDVLLRGLGARWLLVGRDFRFGARRTGDFALLESEAARLGFGLEAMPEVMDAGERVSSSAVRAALAAGELARAALLLEVHLFDSTGDIYGRHLRVKFLFKLRDEEKYDGLEALRVAIAGDAARARQFFATRNHG